MSRKQKSAYILPKLLLKSKRRLKWCLLFFFFLLSLPGTYLLYEANGRLETETFFLYHSVAQDLVGRVDRGIHKILRSEAMRPPEHYSYVERFGPPSGPLQLSPIAQHPRDLSIPGLVGYFQLDSSGKVNSPHLPKMTPMTASRAKELGLTYEALKERFEVQKNIETLLKKNRLLGKRKGSLSRRRYSNSFRGGLGVYSSVKKQSKLSLLRKFKSNFTIRYRKEIQRKNISLLNLDQLQKTQAPVADNAFKPLEKQHLEMDLVSLPVVAQAEEVSAEQIIVMNEEDSVVSEIEELPEVKTVPERKMSKDQSMQVKRNALKSFESGLKEQAAAFGLSEEQYLEKFDSDLGTEPKKETVSDREDQLEAQGREKRIEFDSSRLDESYLNSSPAMRRSNTALQSLASSANINPIQLSMLGTGHFIAYRNAVVAGEPVIQGLIMRSKEFLSKTVEDEFRGSRIWDIGNLVVGFKGNFLKSYGASLLPSGGAGFLLSRDKLSAPFQDLELIFSLTSIPDSSGSSMMRNVSFALIFIFIAGLITIYRLGIQQIHLMNQQQDFVSAVSHELKTPLTSIRMYGEMLQKGWGDEEKKKGYYDFITKESERLSRLIGNVLQLSRINRSEIEVNLQSMSLNSIHKLVEERVRKPLDNSDFEFEYEISGDADENLVQVDEDHLTQILINLVDNGIKFSRACEIKKINIGIKSMKNEKVMISVRDHGPGIPEDHLKSIFKLFYRGENELTRTTKGTGIGLALVYELSNSMGARLEVENRSPGVEFRVIFKRSIS